MDKSDYYHAGEIEVQERANVRLEAENMARKMIRPSIQPSAKDFVSIQRIAIVSTVESNGNVWASALIGDPGFLSAPDEHTLEIAFMPVGDDPVWRNLVSNQQIGALILDPATRKRLRVNGNARITSGGLCITVRVAFTNCAQYIHSRVLTGTETDLSEPRSTRSANLLLHQKNWITQADTFFVATFHPQAGANVSHRGGLPGFVRVNAANEILWPDYSGNNMFQSLGNLQVYPKAGLLFVDFEHGRVLQITGDAQTIWNPEQVQFPGVKRFLQFHVIEIIETRSAFVQRWRIVEYAEQLKAQHLPGSR